MNYQHLLPIVVLLIFSACATSSSYGTLETPRESQPEEQLLHIPAGVDSVTAAEAEQIAEQSFVSFEQEQRAEQLRLDAQAYQASSDSVWYYLTMQNRDEYLVTEQDSIESIRTYNRGAEFYLEMVDMNASSNLPQQELLRRQQNLLDQSISALEESISLNPFDAQTRQLLARMYSIKANRLQNEQEHQRAIDVLEKLVRVEKGEPILYEALADNYMAVRNYPLAAENFQKARNTLNEIATFSDFYLENGHISPRDSMDLFLYAYYEGEAFTNYLKAPEALNAFDEALSLAPTEEDRKFAESEIEFINWDDGNIRASFARDSLVNLVQNDQLAEAESGFIGLKSSLISQNATDEIDWRLAVVEFELGKEERSADRLMSLFERSPKNEDGMPADSTYIQYFNDYGSICLNIGLRHLRERDRTTALKYFRQSAQIKGQNRARANLQIADLLQNNIAEAIRHAEQAEDDVNLLNETDQKNLYNLLTDLHRRNGNMARARQYRQLWSEL